MSDDGAKPRTWPTAIAFALAGVIALAGCGATTSSASHAGSSPSASGGQASTASTATSTSSASGAAVTAAACGARPGVRATGSPIALGAIVTKQPGTDFTDITNMAQAYFTCVNDNGGIKGHPIRYFVKTDQTNPAQIAADANQLIQTDHVLGIVGSTDVLECTVDHAYWHKLGIYELDDGIASECWSSANSATVNMGPRFSSDGAAQYALSRHVSKIVFDQSDLPGWQYGADGVEAVAAADHVPVQNVTSTVPIQDGSSVAIRDVDDAGPNGAVILDYTPPEALVILQAAQKLGLENRVKLWGCSTPCNTDFLAAALGPKWNHKLFVNSELTPADGTDTRSMQLYRAILKQYGSAV
ncbi:MAG: ABC transporter substrate-binding protein, partial [Solirubrobacteraceae bacterium]